MNVIEKIISAHSNSSIVHADDIVDVTVDYIMSNDACTNLAIDVFNNKLKVDKIFNPDKVIMFMDHYTPSSSVNAANTHNKMRDFCKKQNIKNVHDGEGVCHQIMIEQYAYPGSIIIGADSHTCTYGAIGSLSTGMGSTDIAIAWAKGKIWMKVPKVIKIIINGDLPPGVYSKDIILKIIGNIKANGATYKALVFEGSTIDKFSVSERATICNMGIEAGAKFAYIKPNSKVTDFLNNRRTTEYKIYTDDKDAVYEKTLVYDVSSFKQQIAAPFTVDNVKDITFYEGMRINQCFIGACTNGSYEDIKIAAEILKNKKISSDVRLLITPSSKEIYMKASENNLLSTLMKSGAMISNPGCSACFGGSVGLLGDNEIMLSTANRNFKGRVGSPNAQIYLASPAVVAASAITGVITIPKGVISND